MKRKYKISIITLITILAVIFIGTTVYKQHEYSKYCTECSSKYITFDELEQVKIMRENKAIENIEYFERDTSGWRATTFEDSLNEEEKAKFEELHVKRVYDENVYYTIDELIELEKDYETINKEVKELYTSSTIRIYKEKISNNLEEINQDMKTIEEKSLDEYQKEDYAEYKNDLETINYDENKDYSVSDISDINQQINRLRGSIGRLAN